ncbi:unnamed protein product [Rotaria magnacalcarata]|uniref:Uncharacterized protein n=2 Tax=Rotaria magnacalcarata TaxID=392030 RepID=A0A8S2J333_9BILA|nr:unnamed protein product [Rotaria magnacalcarata]
MNQRFQHCFLIDGKTNLPIDDNHKLFIPLKIRNNTEKIYCPCYHRNHETYLFDYHSTESLDENRGMIHMNSKRQDQETFCSQSLQSIRKLYETRNISKKISSSKIVIIKPNYCKHFRSDQQINNNKNNMKKYLIARMKSSVNVSIDSSQINNNQSHKSLSTINIIIKPFMPLEFNSDYHERKISLDRKLSSNKRKSSSSSLLLNSTTKRIFTSLTDDNLHRESHKHRLSTFKDLKQSILPKSTEIIYNNNQNKSSMILNSRTLLNTYRSKRRWSKNQNQIFI